MKFRNFFQNYSFLHLIEEYIPVEISAINDIFNDSEENLEIAEIVLRDGQYIDKYLNLKVYFHLNSWDDTDQKRLFFIHDEKVVIFRVDFYEKDDGIVIEYVWKKRGIGSGFDTAHLYVNYFLQKYNFIMSDNLQTRKGFGIYQKLVELSFKTRYAISVFVVDSSTYEEIKIDSLLDLEKYFGKDKDYLKYRFKITRK